MLLATDGSPESVDAARMAIYLSNKLGSELHVVHVRLMASVYAAPESTILDPELQTRLREMAEQDARERLEEQVGKIEGSGGEVAEAHPKVGRPAAEIVRLAEELDVGLIVLGNRGFSPLRRAVMGSVSLSVVRHAHCSVLVVRGGGAEEKDRLPGKVLLALDGSEEARVAARAAAELCTRTGSELHLTYVLQKEALPFPHYYYAMDKYEADLERAEQGSRAFLEERAKRMEEEGAAVAGVHLRTGNPDHEIVELAEELDAGLVVVGSRGLGGVRRTLLGSVSDSVVRHAHCPVLVVRGEEHE